MIRKAKAVWRGTGRAGNGNLSTDSGVLAETRAPTRKNSSPPRTPAASPWRSLLGCRVPAIRRPN